MFNLDLTLQTHRSRMWYGHNSVLVISLG